MIDLFAYIPQDRRHALGRSQTLPDRTRGAALFADVSGFTPLTRALARELGPRRGAEALLDVLNPQIIVLGSLAVHLGELILESARAEMCREALPGASAACRVVPATLGERLGDVAALCAAIAALGGPTTS